jgi:hypothetical protein
MNISCLKILLGLVIALSIPLAMHADNILINDLIDPVSVTSNGSAFGFTGPGCNFVPFDPNEDCVILVIAPSARTHSDSNFFSVCALF